MEAALPYTGRRGNVHPLRRHQAGILFRIVPAESRKRGSCRRGRGSRCMGRQIPDAAMAQELFVGTRQVFSDPGFRGVYADFGH